MDHWVMAFVGPGAEENLATTLRGGGFCVSSVRTPIRKARSNDRALLYLSGKGFVAQAAIAEAAIVPEGPAGWSSKKPPEWRIAVRDARLFATPVPYAFPDDGRNLVLGFHRRALTGGFLEISRDGFDDVIARAGRPNSETVPESPPESEAKPSSTPKIALETRPGKRLADKGERREREKRVAGQYAMGEGRKRAALWTVAEAGASAFGLGGFQRFARGKVRTAKKTWIAGGRAEERVGQELEVLLAYGFYLFHDVPLERLGNVDHVALGPRGFFAIETKSHEGTVSAQGKDLFVNGHKPQEKDFVSQAWAGAYRLRDVLGEEVAPVLCFTNAFVKGPRKVRGVRVLPLQWLAGEILGAEERYDSRAVKVAVGALSAATGCHPSAAPRA